MFSLHACLLSFYQNITVIIGKQSYHLKVASTSLELRKGLFTIKQGLITSLLQLVSSFASLSFVYYLLAYKSEPEQGIHVSSLTEYKFDGLEFLEFQNKSKNSWDIFHYQIYALSKMKIKNDDSFFKFALLLPGNIQLNPGPTSDVCF